MSSFVQLLARARQCTLCEEHLPEGPRPVFSAHPNARVLIVGQAPGRRVHATGIPWNDPSGERLRDWMAVEKAQFYGEKIAILPMGFCYPGTEPSGDLPPRPECAPQWHQSLMGHMPQLRLTLYIGQYAQRYYLEGRGKTLTDTVRRYEHFMQQGCLPLPHPSPRNNRWLSKNPWFESEVLPRLRQAVQAAVEN